MFWAMISLKRGGTLRGLRIYKETNPRQASILHMGTQSLLHRTDKQMIKIVQLLAMVFEGVHQMCGEVLRCLGSDTSAHIWTSPKSYAQRHLLQHFLPGISHTMINENDACRNDLHWNSQIGCGGKVSNNRKLSYGKVQMQNW